jgi:hypothetical protein
MESAVHLGVDIGKSSHYALAVDAAGKPIYQTSVTNDEMALRKLVDWAKERQASIGGRSTGWSGGVAVETVLAVERADWLLARPAYAVGRRGGQQWIARSAQRRHHVHHQLW